MAWLSILAPAYRYPDGTQRILEALSPLPDGVELLISDNTPNKSVSDVVARYESPNLQYWCNTPALEAVPNWNLLLDRATGDYVMLLHHDEVPLGRDYLALLRATIEATDADVLVQSILLMDASMRPLRPHVPLWLRDWVIRRTPGYLFRRNVIGPTAALVVRRSLYPRFNPALRWLIDVELYVRLRQATSNWQSTPKLRIGSVQDTHQSLTASLRNELKEVDAAERELLRPDFPQAAAWLGAGRSALLRLVEEGLWKAFRIVQAIAARIVPPKSDETT